MALTIAALSTDAESVLQAGFGFIKVVSIAWDNSYPTGGETCDLSTWFPTDVIGGWVVGDTLNDAGYKFAYVPATPSTGVIQVYWDTDPGDAGGANIAFTQVDNTTDLSAINGQRWAFIGY